MKKYKIITFMNEEPNAEIVYFEKRNDAKNEFDKLKYNKTNWNNILLLELVEVYDPYYSLIEGIYKRSEEEQKRW